MNQIRAHFPNRWQILTWSGLLALSLVSTLLSYESYQFGVYRDDAYYVTLARSIVNSDTYGLINRPGIPGQTAFPFGFPLFLAPLVALFPTNIDLLKLIPLAATLACAALLFWGWPWLSRSTSFWWAVAISGLFLLSPLVVGHTHIIMSEPLFLFFSLAATILAEKAVRRGLSLRLIIALALTFTFVLFTRTIGFTIIGAMCVYLWLRLPHEFWKKLPLLLLSMALTLGLIVAATPVRWEQSLPGKYFQGYTGLAKGTAAAQSSLIDASSPAWRGWLQIQVQYTLSSLKEHITTDIPGLVLPVIGGRAVQTTGEELGLPALSALIGLGVCAFILFGAVIWVKREGWSAFNLSAVPYLAVILVWISSGNRLFYPVIPQLILSFLFAAHAVITWSANRFVSKPVAKERVKRGLLAGFVLVLLGLFFAKSLTPDDSLLHTGDLSLRTAWIKQNTAPEAILMSEESVVDYLYGERKTVAYPSLLDNADNLVQFVNENNVHYIIIAPFLAWDKPVYQPDLGMRGNQMLILLEQLDQQGLVHQVYFLPDENIHVYEVDQRLLKDS